MNIKPIIVVASPATKVTPVWLAIKPRAIVIPDAHIVLLAKTLF
jgi:hypothetical protein